MTRAQKACLAFLMAASLTVYWWDVFNADIGTDEPTYTLNGHEYVKALLKGDFSSAAGLKIEHPPVSTWLYGLAFQLQRIPWPELHYYRAPKRLAGLMMALTVLTVFLIGRRLWGEGPAGTWRALWASALLAFMPHVAAHARIAGLAAPSILFWSLSFYLTIRALEPGGRRQWFILLGLSFGLAVGTRLSNGLILVAVVSSLVLVRLRPSARFGPAARLAWPGWSIPLLAWPLVGAALFVALWPWLWERPLEHLFHTLAHWDLFVHKGFHGWARNMEYFLGHSVLPPWYYYLVYLGLTSPLPVLAGLVAWLAGFLRRMETERLLLALWLAAPLLLSAMQMKADGLRYVFHILAPLSLAAAWGLSSLGGWLAGRIRWPASWLNLPLAAVSIGLSLWAVLSFWPYHLDYYNLLAGGSKRIQAGRLLRFGWWGEGVQACVKYIQANLPPGTKIGFYPELSGKFSMLHPAYPLVPLEEADFAVTHIDLDKPAAWRGWDLVFEERLKGAPLARVYRRKPS
jgi:4-amino-4-deoxy-L-arabinose transferase-like glycosyltransferase